MQLGNLGSPDKDFTISNIALAIAPATSAAELSLLLAASIASLADCKYGAQPSIPAKASSSVGNRLSPCFTCLHLPDNCTLANLATASSKL